MICVQKGCQKPEKGKERLQIQSSLYIMHLGDPLTNWWGAQLRLLLRQCMR